MNLRVLSSQSDSEDAWYADGLQFTCTQCGNCCTGGPGFVWISQEEIVRLAEYLKLSPEQVVEQYCRKVDGRYSLTERRTADGNYDCIFLKELEGPLTANRRKACSVYPARPLQCRTWPFWSENLRDRKNWDRSAKRCHGMNSGRQFTLEQIRQISKAADWPENPPSSSR